MFENKNITWAVVGAGDVCEIKSVPAMYNTPGSRVKIVMRRNAEKARDFALRHGIEHWTTSLEDILNDPEIDIVYIATPPQSHPELTLAVAKAGKAVYVEKPMANTENECQAMVDACSQTNVPLFVAYYRRTLPGFLKVKELIEQGYLGQIRLVNIEMYKPIHSRDLNPDGTNWRVVPEMAGGGYFHDLASHQLDYLDFLFGPIVEANGISANQSGLYPADDIVTANYKFENGVIGTGIWCFSTAQTAYKDQIRIVGSKGELSFNTFGEPMTIHIRTVDHGEETLEITHPRSIQQFLIGKIVEELSTGTKLVPSTGISASRTTYVMEQITGK